MSSDILCIGGVLDGTLAIDREPFLRASLSKYQTAENKSMMDIRHSFASELTYEKKRFVILGQIAVDAYVLPGCSESFAIERIRKELQCGKIPSSS